MGVWRDQLTDQQRNDVDFLGYNFDQIITDMLNGFTNQSIQGRARQSLNKITAAGLPFDTQNALVAQLDSNVDAAVANMSAARAQQLGADVITQKPVTPA